jgi:tellurium resistance protein TerZ
VAISLSKGQTVSLTKSGGGSLSSVNLVLSWEGLKKKGFFGGSKQVSVDLDASCLMFDGSKNLVDQVWFKQLASKDGAVVHTGDDQTGGGGETIRVNLATLPANAQSLVFTVNSFLGQAFTQIENATVQLFDAKTNAELAKYTLAGSGPHTALVMAKVARSGAAWTMTAIGTPAQGRTFHEILPAVSAAL